MRYILLTLLLTFAIRAKAEEAATEAQTSQPAVSSAKKKALEARKKRASKKPVEKTIIAAPTTEADRKMSMNKNLQEWLAKMKKRVSASRAKQSKLVAVAAVRGDEKTDPPPLYWKGKEGEKPVNPAEIDKFNAAVETALNGDPEVARTLLQEFVTSYPQSPLVADANETIAKLSMPEPDEAPSDTTPVP